MADKKFGEKRVCPHCEKKFYDLNKTSPLNCPCGEKEIVIEDILSFVNNNQVGQVEKKTEAKDEFADIDNGDNSDDEVISLDEAAIEENQEDTKG